jgi:hypothetical protein
MNGNYLEKFNFLTEYDVSKGGQLLMEQLIPANLGTLQTEMNQDEELKNLLTTPLKELPPQYKYLDITGVNTNKTLFDIIDEKIHDNSYITFFSKAGNKLTGMAGYEVDTNTNAVIGIIIFSFNPTYGDGRQVLKDMGNLLDDLVKKYDSIRWYSDIENPANRYYNLVIKKYDGNVFSLEDDPNVLEYYIYARIFRRRKELI